MSILKRNFQWKSSDVYRALIWLLAIAVLYVIYTNGISTNPGGFYFDESAIAFNAYKISQTGRGEFGDFLPVFFPMYRLPPPHNFLAWGNPVYIYALSALNFIFPPSILLSRLFSATVGFLAALLLGLLAARISQKRIVGIIVALTALITPCFFELSRLVLEPALFPLVLVVFLLLLYSVHLKERWSLLDNVMLGFSLALITYTYTSGRLLGPLFALGLLFFAVSLQGFKNVFRTWIVFGLTLLPIWLFVKSRSGAISQRFDALSYIKPGKSFWEIAGTFLNHYYQCVSLQTWIFKGDLNLRHHIPEMGLVYVATFILAIIGVIVVVRHHLNSPWWRFILFGLIVSVVPSSLTIDPINMLRLVAFPVFLLVLTVPALVWLLDDVQDAIAQKKFSRFAFRTPLFRLRLITLTPTRLRNIFAVRRTRRGILTVLLILTLVQTFFFQMYFRDIGARRGPWFDEAFPQVFAEAMAEPARPIYMVDGYWGQVSVHVYWYATIQKIDLSNFVYVPKGSLPPANALVISTEKECTKCELITKDDKFLLYWMR